jgi:hypothetical protein
MRRPILRLLRAGVPGNYTDGDEGVDVVRREQGAPPTIATEVVPLRKGASA